jgi:hypothetical protein
MESEGITRKGGVLPWVIFGHVFIRCAYDFAINERSIVR